LVSRHFLPKLLDALVLVLRKRRTDPDRRITARRVKRVRRVDHKTRTVPGRQIFRLKARARLLIEVGLQEFRRFLKVSTVAKLLLRPFDS